MKITKGSELKKKPEHIIFHYTGHTGQYQTVKIINLKKDGENHGL